MKLGLNAPGRQGLVPRGNDLLLRCGGWQGRDGHPALLLPHGQRIRRASKICHRVRVRVHRVVELANEVVGKDLVQVEIVSLMVPFVLGRGLWRGLCAAVRRRLILYQRQNPALS